MTGLIREALLHAREVIIERGLNGNQEFAEKWGLTLPLDRIDKALKALDELEQAAIPPAGKSATEELPK